MTTQTTTTALTAHADQLAATLRDRRPFHDGEPCDAFDPCPSCRTGRAMVQVGRHEVERAMIPAQRKAVEA